MLTVQLARWLSWTMLRFGILRDRRAVTSIEYCIIALVIVISIIGGLGIIGNSLSTSFNQVSSEL